MNSDTANTFIDNYRKSMEEQYQSAQDLLKQQRSNEHANLMSNANKAGSLYSNLPERAKIQYDAQNYYPSLNKAFTTYQTGLDKLRNNVANYQNKIKSLDEAIADINGDNIIGSDYY